MRIKAIVMKASKDKMAQKAVLILHHLNQAFQCESMPTPRMKQVINMIDIQNGKQAPLFFPNIQ